MKRIIFLIGDAPPHGLSGNGDVSFPNGDPEGYNWEKEAYIAKEKGITIYTIGCSGIERYMHGEDVFQRIAEITGGAYRRLNYYTVRPEQYYRAYHIEGEMADYTKDPTYDRVSHTIRVNNLPQIVGATVQSAAKAEGVRYSKSIKPEKTFDEEIGWTSELEKILESFLSF